MERSEYITMAQKCSKCENGALKVKINVPDDLVVEYEGALYYPYQYILGFINGKPTHTAILHDLKANSVCCADLEKVKNV